MLKNFKVLLLRVGWENSIIKQEKHIFTNVILIILCLWLISYSLDTIHLNPNSTSITESRNHLCKAKSFYHPTKQLGSLNVTLVATENMYSDMTNPFLVSARVADSETDELISGAQATIMAQYMGGESSPWVANFSTTESTVPPGYYTVNIDHTGAGLYNFTAFVEAHNYESTQTWIIREVKTRPFVDPGLQNFGVFLFAGIAIVIFIIIPAIYYLMPRKKTKKEK